MKKNNMKNKSFAIFIACALLIISVAILVSIFIPSHMYEIIMCLLAIVAMLIMGLIKVGNDKKNRVCKNIEYKISQYFNLKKLSNVGVTCEMSECDFVTVFNVHIVGDVPEHLSNDAAKIARTVLDESQRKSKKLYDLTIFYN